MRETEKKRSKEKVVMKKHRGIFYCSEVSLLLLRQHTYTTIQKCVISKIILKNLYLISILKVTLKTFIMLQKIIFQMLFFLLLKECWKNYVFTIDNNKKSFFSTKSALEWFLKNHVTLKQRCYKSLTWSTESKSVSSLWSRVRVESQVI